MVWRLQGADWHEKLPIAARLAANVPSAAGREDYVPARVYRDDTGSLTADPIFGKSNLIYRMVRADGVIQVPTDTTGIRAGEVVNVYPF
jgi:molybdopterin molybdotransferase